MQCTSEENVGGEVDSLLLEGPFLFVGYHKNTEGIIKVYNMSNGSNHMLTGHRVGTARPGTHGTAASSRAVQHAIHRTHMLMVCPSHVLTGPGLVPRCGGLCARERGAGRQHPRVGVQPCSELVRSPGAQPCVFDWGQCWLRL